MHGGVLGGVVVMVLAIAGWCMFRLCGLDSPIARFHQVVLLVLLIVACGLTFVVNPYGLRLPRVWLEIMRSPIVVRLIEEHAPLDIRALVGWLILLLGLIYAGMLASVWPRRPRITWLIPILVLPGCHASVPPALFAITAVLAMADMLPHTAIAAFLARPGRDLFQFRPGFFEFATFRWSRPCWHLSRQWRPVGGG